MTDRDRLYESLYEFSSAAGEDKGMKSVGRLCEPVRALSPFSTVGGRNGDSY